MDVENLAPLDDKKSEMNGIFGGAAVKAICLKDCNKCSCNGTSPHDVPESVGAMVSVKRKTETLAWGVAIRVKIFEERVEKRTRLHVIKIFQPQKDHPPSGFADSVQETKTLIVSTPLTHRAVSDAMPSPGMPVSRL